MSNDEVKKTPEEEALEHLLAASEGVLSGAGRTILSEAYSVSYKVLLDAAYYSFMPEEYEEAMQKMRLEATRLTDSDREHLAKIVRASEVAASSVDPDEQTPAEDKVYREDLQWRRHYLMMSYTVDEVLQGVLSGPKSRGD